jgi:hypothetical protein
MQDMKERVSKVVIPSTQDHDQHGGLESKTIEVTQHMVFNSHSSSSSPESSLPFIPLPSPRRFLQAQPDCDPNPNIARASFALFPA